MGDTSGPSSLSPDWSLVKQETGTYLPDVNPGFRTHFKVALEEGRPICHPKS